MKTLTIDIINDKAIKLLHELELLQLIRVRKEKPKTEVHINGAAKYKGAMQKQSLIEVEKQMHDLRNAWK